MKKYSCKDVTFLFPLRIDSGERLANIKIVISYLQQALDCDFFILEADKAPKGESLKNLPDVTYFFIKDTEVTFHHTHYRNELIKKASTPIVAIWDTDVLAPVSQVIEAIDSIRHEGMAVAWPYDGICYGVPPEVSDQFREKENRDILWEKKHTFRKIFGWLTNGGAFIVNRDMYIKMGMENEHFIGWGPEDMERLKRITILDYPVYRVKGELYHLWHPRGVTSYYTSLEVKKRNVGEFLRTCSLSKKKLEKEVKLWPWQQTK